MRKIFLETAFLSFGFWCSVAVAHGQQVPAAEPVTQATPAVNPAASPAPTAAPAVPASPAPTVVPVPTSSPATPVPTAGDIHLGGKFAIGTDTLRIDENSTVVGSTPLANSFVALDAIWWLSDDSGIDILASVSTNETPGVDFNGNTYAYSSQIFGGGLGYRCNLSSPAKGLKIQGLARVTYGHYTNEQNLWYYAPANISFEDGKVSSESFNFITGLGFEYFMPFCQSLSVQSYLAFAANYTDNNGSATYNPAMTNYGYGSATNTSYQSSYWRTLLLLNGLSLSSLSVHFYF